MKAIIFINKSIGMNDGWNHYYVEISETDYRDKDKLKSLKMLWNPESKIWNVEGNINTTGENICAYMERKLRKKLGIENIEVHYE